MGTNLSLLFNEKLKIINFSVIVPQFVIAFDV